MMTFTNEWFSRKTCYNTTKIVIAYYNYAIGSINAKQNANRDIVVMVV